MIEAITRVAEVAKDVVKETGKSLTDFDKRKSPETGMKEKELAPGRGKERVNVDKRLPLDTRVGNNLTDVQKKELCNNGFSKSMLDKTAYKDGVYKVKTDNCKLADQRHPDTKVFYKNKVVDVLGKKIEGVFAVFDSRFDAILPENKIIASDKVQFSECNTQLKDAINKNPELRKQFSERQLAQIDQGITPSGYVWHHNEVRGKMQLVDAKTHAATGHTGGKAIWGGGSEAR